MVTGYYPDQISKYTTEEQFCKHREALDAIEHYYNERSVFVVSYDSKRRLDDERKSLERHHRRFKRKKRAHDE